MENPEEDLVLDPCAGEESAEATDLLGALLANDMSRVREPRIREPVIGVFKGFDFDDTAIVVLPSVLPGERVRARSTVDLHHGLMERQVVVICEAGDPRRPIVLGVIGTHAVERPDTSVGRLPLTLDVDGKRPVLTAEREIILRCGDASITLTRAGKIVIRGRYLTSESKGYNRIKGAVVDIN